MKARIQHNNFPSTECTRFTHDLTGKGTDYANSVEDLFFVCMTNAENAFQSHGWEAGKEYTPHDIVVAATAIFDKFYTNQKITLGYSHEKNYKKKDIGEIKEVDV